MADELIAISLQRQGPHCAAQCQKDLSLLKVWIPHDSTVYLPGFARVLKDVVWSNSVVTLISMLQVRGANPPKFCTGQVLKWDVKANALNSKKKCAKGDRKPFSEPKTII